MSSEPEITLYDIASRLNPQAWSPNTWKARIVLNYKRIPYKTVWISYPDIQVTLKRLGGDPAGTTPDGQPLYTLPAIVDTGTDDGSPIIVTDSLLIAEYLDKKYPDRPVFPKQGKALEYAFEYAFVSIIGPHVGKLLRPAAWKILDDPGRVYFRETRELWYEPGKTLEEWSPEGPVREADWGKLQQAWEKVAGILDRNGPGVDYVAGGENPTRADIIIVAYLAWTAAVLPDDWESRVKHWSGGRWARLWELTAEWRSVH